MFTKVNIPSSLVDAVKSITEKKEMEKEELKGGQHKIDMNKNNKIDAHDFAILRAKKKGVKEEIDPEKTTTDTLKGREEKSENPFLTKKVLFAPGNFKEEVELSEDHFKVGDKVKCKESGMTGEVVKLDKPSGEDDEEYYTVKREDGKTMKYSPNHLTLVKEEKQEMPTKKVDKFHNKLDKLVHKTFGPSPDEKMKKEEVEELDELSRGTLASYAKKASHDSRMKMAIGKDFERISATSRKPAYKAGAQEWADKYKSSARKRESGVGKAIDRLAKEEVEELDEASYSAKAASAGKDIGKPGKMFGKIAASAAKRYGSEKKGKAVAGAVLKKLRMKEDVDMDIDDADVEEILNIVEKTLTEPETKKKEEVVKSMKKGFSGFRKRYGPKAKSVMYATATKIAKEKA